MMRSLTVKLTLAFILTSLVGAALAAFFIQQRTRSEFDNFLYNQEKDNLVAVLTEYYRQTGSWESVGALLYQMPLFKMMDREAGGMGHFGKNGMPGRQTDYLLANSDRRIVFGASERLGNKVSVEGGLPIEIDGQVVGWLIASNSRSNAAIQVPEVAFLKRVNQAILFSAIIAVMIAILLGGLLARALTQPLHELTRATRLVSQGKLGTQVTVKAKDELGDLAESFNQMSTDLARSNQARRQMTADIAHDLRTPLSVILGYTEALSDGKLQGSAEIYQVMHQEAGQLSHMVDDLRTLSLADAGELVLNLGAILPETLLLRAAAAIKSQADQKGVWVRAEAENGLPYIQVDADRMAQVFGNLLSNALRYTPQDGWIRLKAGLRKEQVIIQIQDNGSGIAEEDLPNIFNRFYRGSKARQEIGETGLGLAIAKSLVQAHGGTISVESQPGEGTEVTISLPVIKTQPADS